MKLRINNTPKFLWFSLIWINGVVPVFISIIYPRSYNASSFVTFLEQGFEFSQWFARIVNILIFLLCIIVCLFAISRWGILRYRLLLLGGVIVLFVGIAFFSVFGQYPKISIASTFSLLKLKAIILYFCVIPQKSMPSNYRPKIFLSIGKILLPIFKNFIIF